MAYKMSIYFKEWFVRQFPAYLPLYNALEDCNAAQSYWKCWETASQLEEGKKPPTNSAMVPCQYGHGFCANVNTKKCFSCRCSEYEQAQT